MGFLLGLGMGALAANALQAPPAVLNREGSILQ